MASEHGNTTRMHASGLVPTDESGQPSGLPSVGTVQWRTHLRQFYRTREDLLETQASPLLEEKRHRVEITVPAAGLLVDGDRERLAQVITNLLTNAAKYTPNRGTVKIETAKKNGRVSLCIRDDGVGIAPDLLPRVFDLSSAHGFSLTLETEICREVIGCILGRVAGRHEQRLAC